MWGDDEDDNVGEGGEGLESGGGLERRGFQVGARSFDATLEFVMQRLDVLLEIFLRGLRVADTGRFILALANHGLANEFGAGLAAPGVGGLRGSFLESFQLILDLFHFAFFDRAIGRVKDAMGCLLIDGIDFHAGTVRVHGNQDKANRNGSLVARLQEMSRCNGVFTNFEIDVAGTLPGIEKRSGVDGFGAVQNWFLIENQSAMDDLIVNDELHCLANFFERAEEFADEAGSGESFFCYARHGEEKQHQGRKCGDSKGIRGPRSRVARNFISNQHF